MAKRRGQPYFIWLWLCAAVGWLDPITSRAAASDSPFIVDVLTTKDGLPQRSVLSIIQTHDGYLWLGTLNGLVRFDGMHFTPFNEHNTPGLDSDKIVRLFEDRRGNFWVGTDAGGVLLVRDGKVKKFPIGRGGHEGRLMSACEDSNGDVWFYTADTCLARYQSNRMDVLNLNIQPPPTAIAVNCRTIVAEKSGLIWIGEGWQDAGGELFAFRPASFQPPALLIDQSMPTMRLDHLVSSQNGGLWRLIDHRLQKWNSNRLEKDLGIYPWGNVPVTCACEDRDGNLIVGTLGAGIFWYDVKGQPRHISINEGLSSANVASLCVDSEGNLWAGTDGDGLNRIKQKPFTVPVEYQSRTVQSLAVDANDGLWMAFGRKGAAYRDASGTQYFNVSQYSNVWSVLVDRQQRVWAGTSQGLFQFQGGRFGPVPGASFPGLQVFSLFQDNAGQLWMGTQNGLACWDNQNWKFYTTRDGLSENVIRAIAEDADGNLWIGTESKGLNVFKDGKFKIYQNKENELPGKGISSLYVDKDGAVWIGTSGHGLARFYKGQWTSYSTDDGFASNTIGYIIEDESGYLWLGAYEGLIRVKKSLLNDFAAKKINSIICRTFGENDGLSAGECTMGSQPAACRTRDGRLWFPTIQGLASVNPKDIKPNLQAPLVVIESVRVGHNEQKNNRLDSAWTQSIVVPPGREQLEIHYTALNFSAPNEVRFRCWLEGHEAAPTDVGGERVARYPKLPPGSYYFHVQACNEDGVWNQKGATLDIIVQPYFWQTRTFIVGVALALAALIAAAVRYVSTQKLQREVQLLKQQEELEKERARIARDLHDQLGANLTQVALLSEMAEADKNSPAEVEAHAEQISQTARETTRSLDEIVWAVNPSNDSLEGLVNYCCKYAQDYLALARLRYRVDIPTDLPALGIPPEVRHNVFLAFKEAVNNVVKHAQATETRIRLQFHSDHFILEIEDNGRGVVNLNTESAKMRNGLRNMRKRMEDIHGRFEINPRPDGGTIVRLTVPTEQRNT